MSVAVQEMFQSIAHRYDVANDVLSLGLHRQWRRKAIALAKIRMGEDVLDLCTGTGDLAFDLSRTVGETGSVLALDFAENMILHAKQKQQKRNPKASNITFIQGDALAVPSLDNMFDAATISFGIRNVDNVENCLAEIYRVLKPGGRAVILEFGQPYAPAFRSLYNLYCSTLMPLLGGVITGNLNAYRYLPQTSKEFPCREQFLELMERKSFVKVKYFPLLLGIAYIYIGTKEGA